MDVNKYAILSLVIGIILFFGTYFLWYDNPGPAIAAGGWLAVLVTLFYGGLLWLGVFFFLIGLLMVIL